MTCGLVDYKGLRFRHLLNRYSKKRGIDALRVLERLKKEVGEVEDMSFRDFEEFAEYVDILFSGDDIQTILDSERGRR